MVIVHLDFVKNLRVEGRPIGTVRSLQKGIYRHDHRHLPRHSRSVRAVADEGIKIGNVGFVIQCGNRSFAVVRRQRDGSCSQKADKREQGHLFQNCHVKPPSLATTRPEAGLDGCEFLHPNSPIAT